MRAWLGWALVLGACAHGPAVKRERPVPAPAPVPAQNPSASEPQREQEELAAWIRAHFDKREVMIPMRDGVSLFTAIYQPKERDLRYPILMRRTPYSCRPYGADEFPDNLGPSAAATRAGYIFVFQDVRGAYMSEGTFVDVRPHRTTKRETTDVDESSDTYDTIEWLVKNLERCNGRVGMYGISYPGFYAAAGMIDAHPALRAVSPQAPIADWYWDDFHHNGAFMLADAFRFFSGFGLPRPAPTRERKSESHFDRPDGYDFFLELGPLANVDARYFKGQVAFWNELAAHPDYDAFWQARNLRPHLDNVAPAVMTVGGWFDCEDLFGPLHIYASVEAQNPDVFNMLVMGPWIHGGWARTPGDRLGDAYFGAKTSEYYQREIELPFFEHHLKDGPKPKLPEALVFETGANRWREFDAWPPQGRVQRELFLDAGGALTFSAPSITGFDEFVSDPKRPVPYYDRITNQTSREYMSADQRFAAQRPDVLVYRSEPLADDLTIAGPVQVDLDVSTTAGDADWVVKLIDVLPNDTPSPIDITPGRVLGGAQLLVRADVMRGRYRESFEHPKPFVAKEPAHVAFALWDVLHTFKKGHRIMVQVQSSWFPLVDRNPQTYVANIFEAQPADFVSATHRVFRGSRLTLHVLPNE